VSAERTTPDVKHQSIQHQTSRPIIQVNIVTSSDRSPLQISGPKEDIVIAVDMGRTGFQALPPRGPAGPDPCQLRSAPGARSTKIPNNDALSARRFFSSMLHPLFS
jgi:hypothetical protein